ncbi:MAG: hypothetical protein IJ524_01135 [Bacteroidales bacterium]|nr:hypothetical protein [Bacteroidales bacterium]
MIIVADSGSTKTTWMEVETGNKMVTEGLNPHFTTDEQFLAACRQVSTHFQLSTFSFQLYFYGAGCGNDSQRERVEKLLMAALRPEDLSVATDMLGACRAVSGRRESLVGILGTGSNICYYDGQRIVSQPVSTGYVMGDNGSANHVGRILLNDYLTRRMPEEVRALFYEAYPMSDDQFIDTVYHRPHPNRFLASLAPFAAAHQEDDYCNHVILTALYDWHHGPVETLQQQTGHEEGWLNIVGGFAKAIEPTLRRYFADQRLSIGTILADPIDGLRSYHSAARPE